MTVIIYPQQVDFIHTWFSLSPEIFCVLTIVFKTNYLHEAGVCPLKLHGAVY